MKVTAKFWKCVCGITHAVNEQPIRCIGPGHSVYLAPEYFQYLAGSNKPEEKQATESIQATLF